jgi:hypothetical protein
MVFPVTSGTWTAFYERERNDRGAIQRLFRTKLSRFTAMTEDHLDNPVRLLGTISGSNYGNMLLIPGVTGVMQILHHGFTYAGELGDEPDIVAIYGNLSEAALKVIPVNATVALQGNNAGRRSAVDCPTLEDFLGATTPDEFVALEPAGNGILEQKPNHILVGPEIFRLTKGEKLPAAKDLALAILNKFKADDDDDDQVNEARREEAQEAEFLLAMLWASTRGILVPIELSDPPTAPSSTASTRTSSASSSRVTGHASRVGTESKRGRREMIEAIVTYRMTSTATPTFLTGTRRAWQRAPCPQNATTTAFGNSRSPRRGS